MNKVFLVVILLATSLVNKAQSIRIKGSDTMYPFVNTIAELFKQSHSQYSLSVKGGGSGKGLLDLAGNKIELAIASREIKLSETQALEAKGIELQEAVVAYDALSIIVNPKNPITKLTMAQLHDIFTGRVTNWKELGGNDKEIRVFTRKPLSGTYEFMKKRVLKGYPYAADSKHYHKNTDMVKGVSSNEFAIGFCGLAYLKIGVKPLLISEDGGDFVKPNYHNAKDGIYPISRPLYYYYAAQHEKTLDEFIEVTLSSAGQELIFSEGYVPIEDKALKDEFDINIEALFDY